MVQGQMASTLSQQRKGIMRDKDHLRQALLGVAKHSRDLLVKKGAIQPTVRHQVIITQLKWFTVS